ncbi:hypothetical protein ARALYDRAFT_906983 [Arabidopsis lyrata subsp. lyrata]|uniref:DUF7722 domain-containing protein n=2 Tax=Arabidopsis lyrata subsp. lyrata TaxID=81972 RepID=D7LV59_ARALL|nr:hypothetical protein ARALYDRAFT_906983 [Arabidopsis lyrata subsp. lyrata]
MSAKLASGVRLMTVMTRRIGVIQSYDHKSQQCIHLYVHAFNKGNEEVYMDVQNGKNGEASVFRMPLHYPRYSKKDYQDMPEWKLDRVLADYGLSTYGDLAHKRDFAIGAFLWISTRNPKLYQDKSINSKPTKDTKSAHA